MIEPVYITINLKATGLRIKELRKRNKIKVSQMAEMLGSSENAIFKWQRGECLPSLDNLVVLSHIFHTPIDDIIQREGPDEGLFPINGIYGIIFYRFFIKILL